MFLMGRLFGRGKGDGASTDPRAAAGVQRPDPLALRSEAVPVARHGEAAPEKSQRSLRRQAIYTSVRESMIGAGVLSSTYKFKVLSTDRSGTDFVVMVDLAQPLPGGAAQMTWIEGLIERMAASRYDVQVSAVYWRVSDQAVFAPPRPRPRTQVAPPRPIRPAPPPSPVAVTPLTGYEDTEQTDPDLKTPSLSTTQYGDLH